MSSNMFYKSYNLTVPVVDFVELVDLFKEAMPALNLSQDDFVNPKSARWVDVYKFLLEEVMDFPPSQLLQAPAEVLAQYSYPELMETAQPLITLALYMKRLLKACGICDFEVSDLINPEPQRLRNIMSAVINFYFFKCDRQEFYEQLMEDNASKLQMRETVEKEINEWKMEINSIVSKKASQEIHVNEFKVKKEKLQQELLSIGNTISTKKKMLQENKSRKAELKANIADINLRRTMAEDENSQLSNEIVSSPERKKDDLERLAKQLEQLRASQVESKARLADQLRLSHELKQVDASCTQQLELALKITSDFEEQKEMCRKIQILKDRILETKVELEDMDAKEQELKRQMAIKQENLDKKVLTRNNQKESMHNQHQLLKEQQDIMSGQKDKEIDAIFSKIRDIDASEEEKVKHEENMDHMQGMYRDMLQQLEVYHSKLSVSCLKVRSKAKP